MLLAWLLAGTQSLSPLLISKLGSSSANSWVGGFVYILGPCGLPNKFSCEAGSFSRCRLNPQGVFNHRFEALFPCAGPWGCTVYFAPPLFLPVYLRANVGPPAPPATTSRDPPAVPCWVYQPPSCPPRSSSHCLAVSPLHPAARLRPSYGSG